mgnify:FL=1
MATLILCTVYATGWFLLLAIMARAEGPETKAHGEQLDSWN